MSKALSADEWAARAFDRPDGTFMEHEVDGTPFEAMSYGQRAELWDESLRISDTTWHGVSRHGLAALCLAGQEFGFTREDVEDEKIERDYLYGFRDAVLGGHVPDTGMSPKKITKLLKRKTRRIDRIEALLPPEDV